MTGPRSPSQLPGLGRTRTCGWCGPFTPTPLWLSPVKTQRDNLQNWEDLPPPCRSAALYRSPGGHFGSYLAQESDGFLPHSLSIPNVGCNHFCEGLPDALEGRAEGRAGSDGGPTPSLPICPQRGSPSQVRDVLQPLWGRFCPMIKGGRGHLGSHLGFPCWALGAPGGWQVKVHQAPFCPERIRDGELPSVACNASGSGILLNSTDSPPSSSCAHMHTHTHASH